MNILRPGSKVRLPAGDVEAEVLTAQIRAGDYLTYEVAWFVDGERYTAWVEAFEVEGQGKRRRVGFRGCE